MSSAIRAKLLQTVWWLHNMVSSSQNVTCILLPLVSEEELSACAFCLALSLISRSLKEANAWLSFWGGAQRKIATSHILLCAWMRVYACALKQGNFIPNPKEAYMHISGFPLESSSHMAQENHVSFFVVVFLFLLLHLRYLSCHCLVKALRLFHS